MPQICSICRHQQRAEIDAALIGGEAHRRVAKRFGVSAPSVFRHRANCIAARLARAVSQRNNTSARIVAAAEARDLTDAAGLIAELRQLTETTRKILTRALQARDPELALKSIQRLEKQLELRARLLGELEGDRGTQTTVSVVYVDRALIATPANPIPGKPLEFAAIARRVSVVRFSCREVKSIIFG